MNTHIFVICYGCNRPFDQDDYWYDGNDGRPYCSLCFVTSPPVGQYATHPALPDTLWQVKQVVTLGRVRLDYFRGPLGTKADHGLIFHHSETLFRQNEARLFELTILPPLVVLAMAAQ